MKLSADQIMSDFVADKITPYMIATVLNAELEKLGVKGKDGNLRTVRPQMMYNYSSNGLIVKDDKRTGKGVVYTRSEVTEFVTRWVEKNSSKPEVTTEDTEVEGQIALEI